MHLILMGLRGSGKTSVARKIANLLWRTAADSDALALARFEDADTIAEVWQKHGQQAWRDAEADLCRQLATENGIPGGDWPDKPDLVIALGGGVPTIPEAAVALTQVRQAGLARFLYLACRPEVLCRRLQSQSGGLTDHARPALTDADTLLDEINEIAARRDPLYRELADYALDVSDLSVEQVSRYAIQHYM